MAFWLKGGLHCLVAKGDGCQTGRNAQDLLASGVNDINAKIVGSKRDSSQGSHSVHRKKAIMATKYRFMKQKIGYLFYSYLIKEKI